MLSVTELHRLATGLNIEGGDPGRDLRRTGSHKKWVNLVVVLDRPLVDHRLFDEIAATNPYPLLENAIPELNEPRFMIASLMMIGYYLARGHDLLCLPAEQPLRVRIHVHQDVTCQPLLDLLKTYVDDLITAFELRGTHLTVEYQSDQKWYTASSHTYDSIDLLISLSQCAGLDPQLEPGTLIVPTEFIPYDIIKRQIHVSQLYTVDNDVCHHLNSMLGSPYHEYAVKYVKTHYRSANPTKQHPAKELTLAEFHLTPLLQVDRLWNPHDPQEQVTLD